MIVSLQALVQSAGGHAVNGVAEGIVAAALAAAMLWSVSCKNAGTRFAVWFSTLLAVVALAGTAIMPIHDSPGGIASSHFVLPTSWATYAFIAWAIVAALGLLRVLVALIQLVRVRRSCEEVSVSSLDPGLQQILADFRSLRTVKLCVSDTLHVPAAIGFFKPVVVVPRWALTELSSNELAAVVLHELSHLRRRDDWTNLAQQTVRALLFFHPGVWWIDSRLALEREMACDDLVLARTGNPRGYAECLLSVAEKSARRSRIALALAAVTRMRQTALRLTRILDGNRGNDTRVSKTAVVAVMAFAAAGLAVSPHLPTAVTFASPKQVAQLADNASNVYPEMGTDVTLHRRADNVQPQVIPAAMRFRNEGLEPAKSLESDTRGKAQHARKRARPHVVSPRLTRTAMSEDLAVPAIVLVVKTQEFDSPDSPSFTLCIWRMTVVPPGIMSNRTAGGTVAAKTI